MENHMAILYNAKTSNWVNLLQFYNQRFLRGRHGALTKRNSLLTFKKKIRSLDIKIQISGFFWKADQATSGLPSPLGTFVMKVSKGYSIQMGQHSCLLQSHLSRPGGTSAAWSRGQLSLWYGLSCISHIRKPCLSSGFPDSSSSLASSIPAFASLIVALWHHLFLPLLHS